MVGNSTGSGLLFHHRGNCFLMLPKHVHGPRYEGIPVSVPNGAVGQADIVYSTDDATDLSLALVSGGITQDCGPEWMSLPRDLKDLRPGAPVTVVRARQQSESARKSVVEAVTFDKISVSPQQNEDADFFGGTSGAIVFSGNTPVAMVQDASNTKLAWAMRMDEIVARFSRWMGDVQSGRACDDPKIAKRMGSCPAASVPEATKGDSLSFKVVDWSVQPTDGGGSPLSLEGGKGAFVAPVSPGKPLRIEIEFPQMVIVGRVLIRSKADGKTQFLPRSLKVMLDASSGKVRRPLPFVERDMPPSGLLQASRRKTYAKRATIEISSTWGGKSPVRIDEIRFGE